jgi:hypothetical protein
MRVYTRLNTAKRKREKIFDSTIRLWKVEASATRFDRCRVLNHEHFSYYLIVAQLAINDLAISMVVDITQMFIQ